MTKLTSIEEVTKELKIRSEELKPLNPTVRHLEDISKTYKEIEKRVLLNSEQLEDAIEKMDSTVDKIHNANLPNRLDKMDMSLTNMQQSLQQLRTTIEDSTRDIKNTMQVMTKKQVFTFWLSIISVIGILILFFINQF